MVVSCGFCVDFAIYALLVAAGTYVYLANGISFSIGAVLTVILIRNYVFKSSRFRLEVDVMLTFITNGTMFVLGMAVLWLLVDVAKISPYWAKLVANGVTFVMNYITRATLFRRR